MTPRLRRPAAGSREEEDDEFDDDDDDDTDASPLPSTSVPPSRVSIEATDRVHTASVSMRNIPFVAIFFSASAAAPPSKTSW